MSKLAKKPVAIPAAVKAVYADGAISFSTSAGAVSLPIRADLVDVDLQKDSVKITKKNESKDANAYSGTIARSISTIIKGFANPAGHVVNLDLKGVGYKAVVAGNLVTFTLGFSHNIVVEIPEGIKVAVEKNTRVTVNSINKTKLMDFVKFIQGLRKKNVYKGTGMHIEGEFILRKEVKKAKK
jgi:large subunit ribosomal protein L6